MDLAKVTTKVTYRVPTWAYCNMQATVLGQPSKEKCRFCVKEKGYHRCALYDEVLSTEEGTLIKKARACQKAMAGFDIEAGPKDETGPAVDPKKLMKLTITEYNKVRKQLLGQGYPEAIADKLAYDYIMGGTK